MARPIYWCAAEKCAWRTDAGDNIKFCPKGECPAKATYVFINGKKVFLEPKKETSHSDYFNQLYSLVAF